MLKYHRPINVLVKKDVEDVAAAVGGETNPRDLRYDVAVRYKDSGQNKPKPVIFHEVYGLQWNSARFFSKFECGRSIKDCRRSVFNFRSLPQWVHFSAPGQALQGKPWPMGRCPEGRVAKLTPSAPKVRNIFRPQFS